jgi:hypothetical protein
VVFLETALFSIPAPDSLFATPAVFECVAQIGVRQLCDTDLAGYMCRRGLELGASFRASPSWLDLGESRRLARMERYGARSEVVEGVVVEKGSVIGMGVFLGQSTRIYDRASGEVSYGRVPAGSVVVAGSLPSADGRCALSHNSRVPAATTHDQMVAMCDVLRAWRAAMLKVGCARA